MFECLGSQYDKQGNLRNWWEDEDKERFKNATQCFIDQYDNYIYPQLKGKVRFFYIDLVIFFITFQHNNCLTYMGIKDDIKFWSVLYWTLKLLPSKDSFCLARIAEINKDLGGKK